MRDHSCATGCRAIAAVIILTWTHAAAACGGAPLPAGRVAAIPDSRTVVLEDGRRIALAGVEWGVPPDAARAALSALALGSIAIPKGASGADRYGRIHAFLFVSGSETPIQYDLVERGLALADGRNTDQGCLRTLLQREASARAAKLGVWGETGYRLYGSGEPAAILKERGRFAVVEGKVLSVRESGSTIYVNFGRRWSEDFTVTIAKRHVPHFISAGLSPQSLSGRTVRVRGFIEERAGPWIEATRPGQFEIVGPSAGDR